MYTNSTISRNRSWTSSKRRNPKKNDARISDMPDVLEGEITFTIGEKRLVATAGMFANMPVGTPHSFKNESTKPAKMLISVAPAGLERMFFEVGVPVAQGATTAPPSTKEEIDRLLTVAPRYGV